MESITLFKKKKNTSDLVIREIDLNLGFTLSGCVIMRKSLYLLVLSPHGCTSLLYLRILRNVGIIMPLGYLLIHHLKQIKTSTCYM